MKAEKEEKKTSAVVLSKRLEALACMVTSGNSVVDVGCDHGFLSIYLVQQGISPRVLAMDVRKGPLSRAKEHIQEYGVSNYISTRLSDGLCQYQNGEAQTLVCAGMGGRLISKILSESREKARGLKELILQPQSELREFRHFLWQEGYEIKDENILCEEGKYYFIIKAVWTGQDKTSEKPEWKKISYAKNSMEEKNSAIEKKRDAYKDKSADYREICEEFGEILLEKRHPVLKEYLEYRLKTVQQIEALLVGSEKQRTKDRAEEIRKEQQKLKWGLSFYDSIAEEE